MDVTFTITQAMQLNQALDSADRLDELQLVIKDYLRYATDETIEVTILDHERADLRNFVYDLHDFTWLYDLLA